MAEYIDRDAGVLTPSRTTGLMRALQGPRCFWLRNKLGTLVGVLLIFISLVSFLLVVVQ